MSLSPSISFIATRFLDVCIILLYINWYICLLQGKTADGGSDGLKKGDGAGGEGKPQQGEGLSWFGDRERKAGSGGGDDGGGDGGGPGDQRRPPGLPELVSRVSVKYVQQ